MGRAPRAPETPLALLLVAGLLLAPSVVDAASAEESAQPLDVDLEEHVEVQLVLIDFVVLDRQDRTVPGLTLDDLDITVEGREVTPISLDLYCPAGAEPDPRAEGMTTPLPTPAAAVAPPRRIVLAFDYYHMSWAVEALTYAERALDRLTAGGEEHMVVALGESVIVMTPFTRDREAVRQALRRMRGDVRLYGGNYGRLTERRFFDRMQALFDLLERVPDRKSIVLFSGPFGYDGFTYDPTLQTMAGMSARSRTAVYPVDSRGMTTGFRLEDGITGPMLLRRLANETGGRMTANTNDLSLAYARARRDLSCTYTLGFYDRRPRLDKSRRLTVWVKQRGLRAIHSQYYVVRSDERRRESLFRTAAMAPAMFLDPALDGSVAVSEPAGRRWSARLTVEIRAAAERLEPDEQSWQLRGEVRRPWGTRLRRFRRDVTVPPFDPTSLEGHVITLDVPLVLPPGRLDVNLVLAPTNADTPITASIPLVLPQPPDPLPASRRP